MALKPNSPLWNYFTNIVEEGMAECKLCKRRLKNNRSYNLKLHLKTIHKNNSEIDKFFDIEFFGSIAACKLCNKRIVNSGCNLRLHLQRYHFIQVNPPDESLVTEVQSPLPHPDDEDKIKKKPKAVKRKTKDQLGNDAKHPKSRLYINMDKQTIIRSIIGLIVEDGVSPHLLSSKHFQAFLRPMCETISKNEEFKVDDTEIERLVSSIANYIRNDFSNDLHSRLLSIKIDTDINAPPNTFCITAQFIKDGEIQKRILGIIDLKQDFNLKEDHIKPILYKFNIDSNQIISAFWNNTKQNHSKQVENSEYLKEIEQFEFYPDILLGDVKVEPYLGTKAQQCLFDIFKNSNIFEPFLQCRNLVKYISDESNGYYELFTSNNLNIPQLDSPWIVGSTFNMMSSLLDARNILKNVKFEQPDCPEDQFNPNEDLWSFIEAFCRSTNYLQKAILRFHSEELHIGDFYAQWLKCKILTEKLFSTNKNQNNILSVILRDVLKATEYRTKDLLNQDRLTACLYLDPRFQTTLNSIQKSNASEYLKKLWCRAKLYIVGDSENEATENMFDDDDDAFLNEFLSNDIPEKDRGSCDIFRKIEGLELEFKVVDTNILLFWRDKEKSDPELHTLSTICFAIPATEIYYKMQYSSLYQLDAKSNLSTFTKENLLNLRVNAHLLTDALKHLQLTNDEQSNPAKTEVECYNISDDESSCTDSTLTAYSEGHELS